MSNQRKYIERIGATFLFNLLTEYGGLLAHDLGEVFKDLEVECRCEHLPSRMPLGTGACEKSMS